MSVRPADGDTSAIPDDGQMVLARLREIAGGHQLLETVAEREDAELIGGATRDLLLGRTPLELDVVVERGAEALARELADALGADGSGEPDANVEHGAHERFETAFLSWSGGRIDIATRRAESYPAPGALPEVRAGSPEDDLGRRDFTVNAIAVGLAGARAGELRAPVHALEDLDAGRLRVLHDRSFIDDPTRLLRLVRYGTRLGFEAEERTAQLAGEAVRAGALDTLSAARLGGELRLLLRESDPLAALAALDRLGVLAALRPPLRFDAQLARGALEILPDDARADLLLLGSLLATLDADSDDERERAMRSFLDALEFTASERDTAARTALLAPSLVERLAAAGSPSRLREAVRGAPLEAIALAAGIDQLNAPAPAALAAREWLERQRRVRLQINGDDLLSAGLAPGPEIGRRLETVLDMRLDEKIGDAPEEQLRAALDARIGDEDGGR